MISYISNLYINKLIYIFINIKIDIAQEIVKIYIGFANLQKHVREGFLLLYLLSTIVVQNMEN